MYPIDIVGRANRHKRKTLQGPFCLRILLLVILTALAAGTYAIAEAQGSGDWSPPSVLFDPRDSAGKVRNSGTSLVADQAGNAHLVWISSPEDRDAASESVYYYSRWNGEYWTTPVDIFATTSDLRLGWPVLVPAPDGRLHIFLSAGDYVAHSWAWAASADSARAWAHADVAVGFAGPASLVIDVKLDAVGTFHVVYALEAGDVCYVRSSDGGITWSRSVAVSSAMAGTATLLPKLDVADDGRIHAVWTEYQLADGPAHSLGVYYAHSVDGGLTWSEPMELGGFAHSDGNVMAVGDSTVYVAWNGGIFAGPDGGRFFQRSSDGGVTWEGPVEFSPQTGQPGYPSMALDTGGTLHILTASGEYATWDGHAWSSPRILRPHPEIQTEKSRLVVVNGNQLVAVFTPDDWVVYFGTRQLEAPAMPTVLPPTLTPLPPSTATPTHPPTAAEATTVTFILGDATDFDKSRPMSSRYSEVFSIAVSTGLSLTVIGLVVCLHSRHKKR